MCAWTGVPLAESELDRRAAELTALFDLAGAVGPPHWRSRQARRSAEDWITTLVTKTRDGRLDIAPDRALYVIATHRTAEGALLRPHEAAVELLNVLRPTFVAHGGGESHPERHQRPGRHLRPRSAAVARYFSRCSLKKCTVTALK